MFSLTGDQIANRAANAAFDALADIVNGGKEKVKSTLQQEGAPLLVAFLANLSTSFVTGLTLTCIKLALGMGDSSSQLDSNVRKLLAAPLKTAISQLTIAMQLEPDNQGRETKDAKHHRNDRYRSALNSFDTARSLATAQEALIINLCSGLICTRLPGAMAEATIHLQQFVSSTQQRLAKCDAEIKEREDLYAREITFNKQGKFSWYSVDGIREYNEKYVPPMKEKKERILASLLVAESIARRQLPGVPPS